MVDSSGSAGTGSPLTNLLHECVERMLASWCRLDLDDQPPQGSVERFLTALDELEQAAAALCGDGTVARPAPAGPFSVVERARSYAHLAGLLPRALERVIAFDSAAGVIRRPDGELVVDAVWKGEPALADLVRERALQIHRFLAGGVEGAASPLPPRPPPLRSALYVPLVADGAVVGTTYIASLRDDAFTDGDRDVLFELAAHASGAFQRVDGELRGLRATPRQSQVLALVAAGLSDKEIASRLGVSPRTVRTHLERVLHDHGLASRTEAATAWLRGERR